MNQLEMLSLDQLDALVVTMSVVMMFVIGVWLAPVGKAISAMLGSIVDSDEGLSSERAARRKKK